MLLRWWHGDVTRTLNHTHVSYNITLVLRLLVVLVNTGLACQQHTSALNRLNMTQTCLDTDHEIISFKTTELHLKIVMIFASFHSYRSCLELQVTKTKCCSCSLLSKVSRRRTARLPSGPDMCPLGPRCAVWARHVPSGAKMCRPAFCSFHGFVQTRWSTKIPYE